MNKSKKSIIIFVFLLFPVFMWGETYFFWDLGSGSIDARINQNRFESNLSLAIGDLYLKEEKTNLVFNIEPVLCNFFLESKETAYPELPQRDLKSMFLLNTKISWNPIDTDYICFGPYMSANYLNPFNISELLVSSGLEFSLFMPIYDDIYIPKILSIETGFLFSNDNKKNQYYFYGKLSFNLGIIVALLSNGLK